VAKRFTELVGQPPMQYLTHWRMQVAANRLAQSGAKVATIAREVGYDSEAAFSRAFKKVTGVAPGGWRHSRTEGRKDGKAEGQKIGRTGVIPSEARDFVRE
jgi:AraC-like DNA-binding protein